MSITAKDAAPVVVQEENTSQSRRKFFSKAGAAAVAVPLAGFPMISVAQAPVVLKMQGAWGAKDVFNEMAEDYVKKVNEMSGGKLKIDYLVGGSV
ncbi:MAG: hypothetical protein B7Y67_14710, partial [Polynucleobacter sp. 35-46-11]